ncbi:MAG: zinc ribbon domain-containing protein [Acidobacteriota bacterium]
MDDKIRCQSCGMPLSEEFKNFGTEADGSRASEYCMFCYQDGDFINPGQTVDEVIRSSIRYMTANLGFSEEHATQMSNDVIPKLNRWQ